MTDISMTHKISTITLTDRPPVQIVEVQWPLIARGGYEQHDGQIRSQANRTTNIDIWVRQHSDGRAIVYGIYDYDTLFQGELNEVHKVGLLLGAGDNLVLAVKGVVEQLIDCVSDEYTHRNIRAAGRRCIADLPAEIL